MPQIIFGLEVISTLIIYKDIKTLFINTLRDSVVFKIPTKLLINHTKKIKDNHEPAR